MKYLQMIKQFNKRSIITQIRSLNLQEYQSKELLRSNECRVQHFILADNTNNKLFESSGCSKNWSEYVIKAQILAGGRGKGHFIGGKKGRSGVVITKSRDEANKAAIDMLGNRLVTKQTSPDGVLVNKVMIAESVPIKRETYLSLILDASHNGILVVACPIGGMDIEEVARDRPAMILKEPVSVHIGITDEQCGKVANFLGFKGTLSEEAAKQIKRIYDLFIKVDATQIEINPFAETEDSRVFCIDAKLNFDDSAFFRQREIFEMDTFEGMDKREVQAKKYHLNYIGLDGNIACMVNGAGLAMATMDLIKLHGGSPANFLDVGGGATVEQVYEAMKIITSDLNNIRAIFVNIFAGIMRCDIVAQGIIKACADLRLKIPIVIRLKGTRVEEATSLLLNAAEFGNFQILDSLEGAAKKAVELSNIEGNVLMKECGSRC